MQTVIIYHTFLTFMLLELSRVLQKGLWLTAYNLSVQRYFSVCISWLIVESMIWKRGVIFCKKIVCNMEFDWSKSYPPPPNLVVGTIFNHSSYRQTDFFGLKDRWPADSTITCKDRMICRSSMFDLYKTACFCETCLNSRQVFLQLV